MKTLKDSYIKDVTRKIAVDFEQLSLAGYVSGSWPLEFEENETRSKIVN